MSDSYKYDLRGVSATKDEVHAAIKHLDKGLFPTAFCKILPDIVGGDANWCNIMHADTAGTKTSLAYLYWKETGDINVWKGIVQDAIVMNLDDMACVGCVDQIVLSSTIGRNKNVIPGEVISTIINAAQEFMQKLGNYGCNVVLAGGETADVGDIVRTIDVGYTAFARMRREDLVINRIKPGNVIVGVASYGKATYEDKYNGGMGSNGLTSARHDVLHSDYADAYPESYDPAMPASVRYIGSKRLIDPVDVPGESLNVGQLVLSPTRTYMPLLHSFFKTHRKKIDGMIHCTGGAQTKVLKFIEGVHVIKDNLFDIPPLFRMIQEESGTIWKEMYQVFNMGHRLEVYLNESEAPHLIGLAKELGLEAQIIGRVEASEQPKVTIKTDQGNFEYF